MSNICQIALCDDETAELDKTQKMLDSYRGVHPDCAFSVRQFESAEELFAAIDKQEYLPDILFLDIYMSGMSGMEAAKELRLAGKGCRIVFLTSSTDFALDAFQVDATQYLVKPISEHRLCQMLDRLFAEIESERRRYVLLSVDNRKCRIAIRDIIYCEAQKKNQYLHLADGTTHCLHMSMIGLEELLSSYPEILRIANSYIVNLEHIDSISINELLLDDGTTIYLPRGAYRSLRKNYLDYYCEDLNGEYDVPQNG